MEQKQYKRTTITAALPYANGGVHIGHLAGVYVPADIYARYMRLKNEDVVFIGGSDEHGVPITIRARKEGVSPQDVVDRFHAMIKKSFEDFGISFDIYSRTTSPTHHQLASDFFKKLYEDGKLLEKETEQYYDEEAHQFLADRYITGECPHCHNEGAYGDQCEKCGRDLSPTELLHPRSTISGSQPVLKKTKNWYLPLDQYQDWLKQWILEGHKEWRPNVYGQCKSWLDLDLQPRAMTRDLDWGIPVPIEGAEGKGQQIMMESFRTIEREMRHPEVPIDRRWALFHAIHTTADFSMEDILYTDPKAVSQMHEAIKKGEIKTIVTDVSMVAAGIRKGALERLGLSVKCYITDPRVVEFSKMRGTTRAEEAIRLAVEEDPNALFAFGNAPTALIELCRQIRLGKATPSGIIAAPVGFVHVCESKHRVHTFPHIPKIIVEGRRGGSNLAATLINAILCYDDAAALYPGRDV